MNDHNPKTGNSCICCGQVSKYQFSASPLDYCLDKEFDIYRCTNCGHGYTDKVESSDLTLVYEEGAYDPKEKFWHKILRPAFNVFELAKVKYMNNVKTDGKMLLEVGTGKGSFLQAAIKAGYDAYGIEPSLRSYKVAKAKIGERVFNCTLEEMHLNPLLNKKYDFIMLWHVLEHLHNPEEIIGRLQSFLKPGGTLIVGVPNFDSYQSRVGKSNWYHLDPPRHLSHFTPASAGFLFKKKAMEIKKIYYNSFFQNLMGEIVTLNNMILPHKNILLNVLRFNGFYFKKTNPLARILNLFCFALITAVAFLPCVLFTHLSQLLKKSGTIVFAVQNSVGKI